MASPNLSPSESVARDERKLGVTDEEGVFDLDIEDRDLVAMLDEDIKKSEAHWDEFLRVKNDRRATNVRDLGEKALRGDYYPGSLHDHQIPYVDNRIAVSADTSVARLTAEIPEFVAKPAQDNLESKRQAKRIQLLLKEKYRDWGVKDQLGTAILHLLAAKRIGILKGRYDADTEEIVWEAVRPETVVVDQHAKPGTDPRFVAEYLEGTVEELVTKFPKKKQDIYREANIIMGTRKQQTRRIGYREVWFRYLGDDGKVRQAVCWLLQRTVLGKMKDLSWIEESGVDQETGQPVRGNHLKNPRKPYVFLNFRNLNFGKSFLDDTSYLEQALPQQDVVNKRGRQLVEWADAVKGSMVYDARTIPPEAVEDITGDPTESVLVYGDVRSSAIRLPPPNLPDYVYTHLVDARNEIDNIFSTHAPTRGEPTKNKTLGQDILLAQRDTVRADPMAAAVEKAVQDIADYSLQLMKVFYTEKQFVQVVGPTGRADFIKFSQDSIEDGLGVTVAAGSLLPTDKFSRRAEALELFSAGALDPVTLYEELDISDPVEKFRRLLLYKSGNPAALLEELESQDPVRQAFAAIKRGEMPELPDQVDENTVKQLGDILEGPQMAALPPEVRQRLQSYGAGILGKARQQPAAREEGPGNFSAMTIMPRS